MALHTNSSLISPELNRQLAEQLNEEMKSTVMPVTVFVGIETVIGFCGNLLIWYVFLFHYRKCNFKYFVLCLAFVDTTSTLTTMPGEIVTQTFWYVYPVPTVCKIKSFFNVFTVCGSAFGLLIISVDRFRKICRPLEWQIKPKVAMILIFVQFAISFVVALPVAFFWGTHSYQKYYNGHTITVTVCEKDAKFKNTDYPLEYTIVTEVLISAVIIVMFVLYIFICRQLLTVKSTGRTPSDSKDRSQRDNAERYSSALTSGDDDTTQNNLGSKDDTIVSDSITDSRSDDNLDTNKKMVFHTISSSMSVPEKCSERADRRIKVKKITGKKHSRRIRRKTIIMFILTAVFIFTTVLYLTLLNLIANNVLETLSKSQKSIYFFFFRLYFINHVINPILYGLLDPQFRRILKQRFTSRRTQPISTPATVR